MGTLGKYIIKIFSLVECGGKDSAIRFTYKSNSKLSTPHAVGIGKAFQFFNGSNFFKLFGFHNTFNCCSNLLSHFGIAKLVKLSFVFFTKGDLHVRPIFFITWFVLARPLLLLARTSFTNRLFLTSFLSHSPRHIFRQATLAWSRCPFPLWFFP